MKEKKAITKKVDESTLRNIIYKKVLKELNLKEFRSDDYGLHGHDGDFYYTRPNGETNIGTKLKWSDNSNTKRSMHNHRLPSGELPSVSGLPQVVYGHGKGSLCNNVIEFIQKEFQVDLFGKPTGKIEWTEKEQEAISNITTALSKLAQLTKEEGNKKRGYDGPEESDEEEINESLRGFFQTLASESNPEPGQVTGDQLGSLIGRMDKYTKAELRKMLLNGYKVFVNSGGSARNQYGMKFLYKVVDTQGNVVSYITPVEKGEYKGMYGLVRA